MGSLGSVALFNSNLDALVLLGKLLESAGFTVVSALIPDVRSGRCDVNGMLQQYDPSVIVYDIGPPYEENWKMFEELRASTSMRHRRCVITAVNAARVEQLAASDDRIYEVVDKASDLGEIVKAVKEAARAHIIRAEQPRSNVTMIDDRRQLDRRQHDRRQPSWSADDIYMKLREKREAVEFERRRAGRRATDPDQYHAA
jgi:response regulator RpfG family c-di-GMP phosphodiesterase